MKTEELIVNYINILAEIMRQSMREYKTTAGSGDLFNLTITQLHYLHAIANSEGPTFSDLVDKFAVKKSTVTVAVNRLIQQNLVYKQQSDKDLRVYHIFLTEKGEKLLEIERQGYFYFARRMTTNLAESDKVAFTNMLGKIIGNISDTRTNTPSSASGE